MSSASRGFYFSFDAIIAMTVMIGSIILVSQISSVETNSYRAETTSFRKSTTLSQDALKLASRPSLRQVINSSYESRLLSDPGVNVSEEDLNRSFIDAVTFLWAQNSSDSREYARNLTRKYFSRRMPEGFGFRVQVNEDGNPTVIYNTSSMGSASIVSAATRPVSGHRIGSPSEGFQARVALTSVTRNQTRTVFFGGYVGDGDLVYTPELPDLDEALNATLVGDFSGPFDLDFNGNSAGSYTPENSGNLSADRFQVCTENVNSSRCDYLKAGENTVRIDFTGSNKSVGGGYLKIEFNRSTGLTADEGFYETERKQIPGIKGIINYYAGFYVPGDLHGINARLHYKSNNQTVFMRIGNSTVYEKKTKGEETVQISNSSLYANLSSSGLSFGDLSRETVPLRVGLANIDKIRSRAIADSVSVVDVSGSMGNDPDGDGTTLLDEAKNASKTFADIILNASTNRAGVVSYEDFVEDVQELTQNYTKLEKIIEAQSAGGSTCIGCGIREARNQLVKPYIENLVPDRSEWQYTTDYLNSRPPIRDGRNWTELEYNSSDWSSGKTLIGTGPGAETVLSSFEGNVYLRKEFFAEHKQFRNLTLRVLSNDKADVYLNGKLVDNDTVEHLGKRWNRQVALKDSKLNIGLNVLAVRLENAENDTVHWNTDNSSEWDSGSYSNTTELVGNLSLYPEYTGTGSDVDSSNYCSATGGTYFGYFSVDEVEFEAINRNSGDNGGYLDATDSVTGPLSKLGEYWVNVTLETSGYNHTATVAFDWDGDDKIKDDRAYRVGSCSSTMCEVSRRIDVPETSSSGSHLMRVMAEYDSFHEQPCQDTTYNEIEDYSAFVGYPEYSNGTYLSKTFNAGDKVSWKNVRISNSTPPDTNFDLNFSDGSNWYETLSAVPDSSTLRYAANLTTYDQSRTPEIDEVDISYLVDSSSAGFDAEINGSQERKRSMIVMSDGAVNIELENVYSPDHSGKNPYNADCGTAPDDPCDDTIEMACRANARENITVYAVGFGSGADNQTLNQTAQCGGGEYYYSSTGELQEIFRNISNRILNASFVGQTIETGDEDAFGRLYEDSYLEFNYSSNDSEDFGEIGLSQVSPRFGGNVKSPKNGSFRVPPNTELQSARVLSYSGNRWTDRMWVKNKSSGFTMAYNLSEFGDNYQKLGDPAIVSIPVDLTGQGVNNVSIDTALNVSNPQGGSPDNRIFYRLLVDGSVGYGDLFPTKQKARQDAVQRLKNQLDTDNDGNIDVDLDGSNLKFSESSTTSQPYVWGPALFKVVVWK